jgi:hypothetical protein
MTSFLVLRRLRGTLWQKNFVHVAPLPTFAGFEGAHHGMFGLMKMLGSMRIFGRVAAAYMSADEALPQVDPSVACLQALPAAFATGGYFFNFVDVGAGGFYVGHGGPLLF